MKLEQPTTTSTLLVALLTFTKGAVDGVACVDRAEPCGAQGSCSTDGVAADARAS